MPEGEGGGGKLNRFIEIIDHPIIFALAITFVVVPMMALLTCLFKFLGMPGPASLFQTP